MLDIHILTVFPQFYRSHYKFGLISKALQKNKVNLTAWSLRRFTEDDYGQIDDKVYGGKFGMVMKPEPYFQGVEHIKSTRGPATVFLMGPGGKKFDYQYAEDLSTEDRIIILTGRYEGVDQRVADHLADEMISVGDFVTPGGDLPALTIISSIIRQIPAVVSNKNSVQNDSFKNNRLAPPHYTRPRKYLGYKVPEVLTSGDHSKIEHWRMKHAEKRTRKFKPGLKQADCENEENSG